MCGRHVFGVTTSLPQVGHHDGGCTYDTCLLPCTRRVSFESNRDLNRAPVQIEKYDNELQHTYDNANAQRVVCDGN